MKAFLCSRNRHTLLTVLLCVTMTGGSLPPLFGAEAKSKKSSSKSASSATSKAKKTTPKSSTPKTKKAASSAASKAKKREPASAQKSRPEKKDSGVQSAPEIPGQPAPPLPKVEPAASAAPTSAAQPAASGADVSDAGPMPVALTVAPPAPPATPPPANDKGKPDVAPNVSLDTEDLFGFEEQPPRVQKLIHAALELTRQKLTYTYGSADPAKGGMDCSGAIYYLLTQQGFKDVPRDASGQYVWARKTGAFFAVVSKKADSFEFGDLLPGDLLFWSGTYNTDRDPPVTHTMIYLGVQRKRAQHVMWGSSDGRTYDSRPRWGVSVFDFKMPRADKNILNGAKADFLGYARIPGLRE